MLSVSGGGGGLLGGGKGAVLLRLCLREGQGVVIVLSWSHILEAYPDTSNSESGLNKYMI